LSVSKRNLSYRRKHVEKFSIIFHSGDLDRAMHTSVLSDNKSRSTFRSVRRIAKKRLLVLSCSSVCPRGTTRHPLKGFSLNLIFKNFSKICQIQDSLKQDENNKYYTRRSINIFIVYRSIHFRMRNISNKFADKITTHISCSMIFFFENRTVYEIMWKNIAEPDKPRIKI
jgi:hypothetical protein